MQSFSATALSYTHPFGSTFGNFLPPCATIRTINYCHMTQNMIRLSYDTTRRLNDGDRTAPIAYRERMDSAQANHEKREGVLLCNQVEARSGLYHLWTQIGDHYEGGHSQENQCSVTTHQNDTDPPIFLWRDRKGGP